MTLHLTLVNILLEGKLEDLMNHQQFSDIPDSIKNGYKNKIPNNNTNHLRYILSQHQLGHVKPNDDIHHVLSTFDKVKQGLDKKQVNQYKTFDDLKIAVEPYKDVKTKKEQLESDTNIIYHTPTMKITKHDSHDSAIEAAILHKNNEMYHHTNLKGKAEWCVSTENQNGKNAFDLYTNPDNIKHDMYTIETPTRKYAFIHNTSIPLSKVELRDEKDNNPYVEDSEVADNKLTETDNHVTRFVHHNKEILKTPLKDFFIGEHKKIYNELEKHHNDNIEIPKKLSNAIYKNNDIGLIAKMTHHSTYKDVDEATKHSLTITDRNSRNAQLKQLLNKTHTQNIPLPESLKTAIEDNVRDEIPIMLGNNNFTNQKELLHNIKTGSLTHRVAAVSNDNLENRALHIKDLLPVLKNSYDKVNSVHLANILNDQSVTHDDITGLLHSYFGRTNENALLTRPELTTNDKINYIKNNQNSLHSWFNKNEDYNPDELRNIYDTKHIGLQDRVANHKNAPLDVVRNYVDSQMKYPHALVNPKLMNKVLPVDNQAQYYFTHPNQFNQSKSNIHPDVIDKIHKYSKMSADKFNPQFRTHLNDVKTILSDMDLKQHRNNYRDE